MLQAVVIYDTKFGNTERIAQAIASGLRDQANVEVMTAPEAATRALAMLDLLVVGGPTPGHGMSKTLRAFVESLPKGGLRSTQAALFDTRYHMAAFLTGSAARQASGRVRRAGCRLVAPPESFFVEQDPATAKEKGGDRLERLAAGELDRAADWGRSIATAASPG